VDGVVVDCDGRDSNLCSCIWTQGTADAVDRVYFCDGTDECESTHTSILQGPRHRHRLHGVRSLYNSD